MLIIQNSEQLLRFIPNAVNSVKGEIPLYDKLLPFIESAQRWVCDNFVPEYLLSTTTSCARLVAIEAYLRAIPQLDIVLTPNGFATVGTQNLVPASRLRVDKLIDSLLIERDNVILEMLSQLRGNHHWIDSEQANQFAQSLFPDFSIVDELGEVIKSKWNKWRELRSRVIDIEDSLAEDYVSPELMNHLRKHNLDNSLSVHEIIVINMVKTQIGNYLINGAFNSRRLGDIVNYIRTHPEDFEIWVDSETSKLFAPPVFRNNKKAAGYFF